MLVPNVLPPNLVRGAYVSCDATLKHVEGLGLGMKFKTKPYLFFEGPA